MLGKPVCVFLSFGGNVDDPDATTVRLGGVLVSDSTPRRANPLRAANGSTARAPVDIPPREIVGHFLFIAFVLGIPFGIATSSLAFRDGDVSWQVAAGQWIIAHARIPTADPFSFTAAGRPWVAMEWLSEIVYATAYRLAGWNGLAATVACATVALNALIFFYLQRRASIVVVAVSLFMLDIVVAPFVLARPHVLAWPLLAAWTIVLLRAAENKRPPSLWWTLLLVVWTNAHASFPLALPIAAAIALDSVIEARWTNVRQWIVFGIVSVVALSCNANGLAGLLQPFKTASLTMLHLIGEWHPSSTANTPEFFGVLLLALGAICWTGLRIPAGRLLLLLVLLGLAFLHVRHQSTFIIVAVLVVPALLDSKPARSPLPKWLLLGFLPMLAYALISPRTPPEGPANPRSLIAAVPTALRSQPVFNEYSFGGPLILAGIKPYIDGRGELYGDAFVEDYSNIIGGDMAAFNRAAQRYDIRWTMLPRDSKALIAALEGSGKWRRIYADRVGVIDVRSVPITAPTASGAKQR